MMDHEVAHSDHMKLRVDEIAEKLSVTRRTVYSMIEREQWVKEEGIRGRVWYHVPGKFIEDYIRSAQEDQSRSVKTLHTVSQPIPQTTQQSTQSNTTQLSEDILKTFAELGKQVLAQAKEIVEVQAELKDKRNEIITLNNERANSNTQLTKYKDTKKELEEYQEKLKAAQKIADEAEQAKKDAETAKAEADKLRKLAEDEKKARQDEAVKFEQDAKAKDDEINTLKAQLEAEKKKGAWAKLFGQ